MKILMMRKLKKMSVKILQSEFEKEALAMDEALENYIPVDTTNDDAESDVTTEKSDRPPTCNQSKEVSIKETFHKCCKIYISANSNM